MTGRYGLLGKTLSHSLSPQIHNYFGDYSYELMEKNEDELAAFFKNPPVQAMNVTIPYKKTVIPFCTELDDTAQRLGSVNTIRFDGETVRGYNTDYFGFAYLLQQADITVAGKKVVVLGSGGASATVCGVLWDNGAAEVTVVSRSGPHNYNNLQQHRDADIVVNTTPVGMYPETEAAPVSLDCFEHCEAVADVIYNPLRTRLLLDAGRRGIKTANGLTMLVAQGFRAAEIFLGQSLDRRLIEKATRELEQSFRNIVLVGMPGCGKSTQAALLAEVLGRKAVDSDAVVEQRAGKPIPQIFAEQGEAAFRKQEAAVVQELGKRSGLVIATGGGAILTAENRDALRQNAVVVFLEKELEELATVGRPLSQDMAALQAMYEKRLPLYREVADVTVAVQHSPQETCRQIQEALKR